MKRRVLWSFVGFASLASLNAYGIAWPDMWSRPDQRAQALLDAGRPADAIPLFADGRRKAYAEIRAQRYREAAKRLLPFADPASEYNRGNALARAGELPAALTAYDAALRRTPPASALHRDARHNRDLVARQLQAQKSQQAQSKQHARGTSGQGNNGQGQGSGQQGDNLGQRAPRLQQPGSPEASGDGRQSGQVNPPAPAQPAPAPSGASQPQASQSPQGASARQDAERNASAQPAPSGGRAPNLEQQPTGDVGAEQAKRDAAAALGRAPPSPRRPESEQALALEQWLRWIPDDPAGLLRRKFMIEHMLKQQDAQK